MFSCDSDNEIQEEIHLIVGEWQLNRRIGGFGVSSFFEEGEVIYSFDTDGVLTVNSSRTEIESEMTDYNITEECRFLECFPQENTIYEVLYINGIREVIFELDNESMVFGTSFVDGFDYYFERVE